MKGKQFLGLGIVLLVILVVVVVFMVGGKDVKHDSKSILRKTISVKGIATKEVVLLYENEKSQKTFSNMGFDVKCIQGSTGGMTEKKADKETGYLIPASELAAEDYQLKYGKVLMSQPVFSSPIIAFTDADSGDGLIKSGIAKVRSDGSAVILMPKLIAELKKKTKWKSIGVDQYGPIKVRTTNIAKTASGIAYMNMLAFIENNDEVTSSESVNKVADKIRPLLQLLGQTPMTTDELMNECVRTGCYNVYLGLESTYIRYAKEKPEYAEAMAKKLRMFYLEPAVWGHHAMIALTPDAAEFMKALINSNEMAEIAWKDHGLRTGTQALKYDVGSAHIKGLTAKVGAPIAMPTSPVNNELIDAVLNKKQGE